MDYADEIKKMLLNNGYEPIRDNTLFKNGNKEYHISDICVNYYINSIYIKDYLHSEFYEIMLFRLRKEKIKKLKEKYVLQR